MPGFEPGASYMRSKRSTAELHPQSADRTVLKLAVINDAYSQRISSSSVLKIALTWSILLVYWSVVEIAIDILENYEQHSFVIIQVKPLVACNI